MTEQVDDVRGRIVDSQFLELIRSEINTAGGALPFDRYMGMALYHPQFGYYTHPGKRIGKDGDFITSVSIGRCFGMLLARHLATPIRQLAASEGDLLLVEPGAENGDLAVDMMNELARLLPGDIYNRLCYVAFEPFSSKKQSLRERLERLDSGRFRVVSQWQELTASRGVLVANEFLDAMPVKRLRWKDSAWLELCVGNSGESAEEFNEIEQSIEDRELAAVVDALPVTLGDGFTIEVNMGLERWFNDLSRTFEMLHCCLIDYGLWGDEVFDPVRKMGTLRGYVRHRMCDSLLSAPGISDLTAHVDFERVRATAASAGFEVTNLTDQHRFLVTAAKPWLLEIEASGPPDAETVKLLHQFKSLSHPTMMGSAFKVLEMSKGMPIEDYCVSIR
ncbi:MAG: SAM-dependent methyltransferase [Verrucomicrobiales bacterium]